jgi:hypothetical protein
MLVLANIIFGVGYILYFSVSEHSFFLGLNIYQDLISNYINNLIDFWNGLINHSFIEDSLINEPTNKIKHEIKQGIKDGVKEALDEIMEDISNQAQSNLLKNIALSSSVLIFGYVLFYLPGSGITPEDLSSYNWFNQSIIEVKLTVFDLIHNLFFTGNPGTPPSNGPINPGVNSPITPNNVNLNVYLPNSISPSNSIGSEGLSTITPNTPIASSSSLTPIIENTATVWADSSAQTDLDGLVLNSILQFANHHLQNTVEQGVQTEMIFREF